MSTSPASAGLGNDWAYQVIKQVGNYGESFDPHVGTGSPLKIDRGSGLDERMLSHIGLPCCSSHQAVRGGCDIVALAPPFSHAVSRSRQSTAHPRRPEGGC
jgi:hypothetical protein